MTIAKRLKEFRSLKHLTIAELSKSIGLPARTLGSYERGEAYPGSKFYDLMIQKYNLNVNWIITGRGKVFINEELPADKDSILKLQSEIKLSNDDMTTLIEILKSNASKNLILKFIFGTPTYERLCNVVAPAAVTCAFVGVCPASKLKLDVTSTVAIISIGKLLCTLVISPIIKSVPFL